MMDPLVQAFLQYVRNERLFDKGAHLLVAASGGLDSTVLCHLCHTAGFSFSIAHCHFGLRGAESDRDAAFVRELAHEYGVPFYSRRFDTETFAREQKLSIQEAARNLRYRWFEELIAEPATYNEAPFSKRQIPNSRSQTPNPNRLTLIATAHHLDDNVETMLMNFFKGTGISGLRGMRQRQGRVVRPLLFAR
ncbi:MAG TPA: tRNA lysidine(34) synthetase TilS, partial [Chitinophagaceae bacterium]|nr:tRNA lysidine(34) synthetase TilS [Chitinophagaceae bacterium]